MPPVYEYATLDDLAQLGVGQAATRHISATDLRAVIVSTSGFVDSFLRKAEYALPLLEPVDLGIREATAAIAVWRALKVRGYNPSDPAHELIRQDYEDKVRWLEQLAEGNVVPVITPPEGGEPVEVGGYGVPIVVSSPQRGWWSNGFDGGGGPFTGGPGSRYWW